MAESWFTRRSDLYHVDPRTIVVIEGWNPRHQENFALDDLLLSIKENGILVPLRCKRNREGVLELRDGERRYRAVMQLIDEGVPILTVPCILEKSGNDADLLLNAMLANTGRPFTDLESATGYRRFLAWGWTIEQLAQRIGKSVGTVRNVLSLLDAAPVLVEAIQNGTVSRTEAVAVIREARQEDMDQGEILVERQAKKREKKKTAVHRVLDVPLHPVYTFAERAFALCEEQGAEEVINAVLAYLHTHAQIGAYYDALMAAQDLAAQHAN